ncbi:MAG: hypothetical protein N3A63_07100 [Bacteroidetes bacterium]|nr:hypothetical protein [Bacteroidota bacterium]
MADEITVIVKFEVENTQRPKQLPSRFVFLFFWGLIGIVLLLLFPYAKDFFGILFLLHLFLFFIIYPALAEHDRSLHRC